MVRVELVGPAGDLVGDVGWDDVRSSGEWLMRPVGDPAADFHLPDDGAELQWFRDMYRDNGAVTLDWMQVHLGEVRDHRAAVRVAVQLQLAGAGVALEAGLDVGADDEVTVFRARGDAREEARPVAGAGLPEQLLRGVGGGTSPCRRTRRGRARRPAPRT
jgi:hypothetical protein